MNNQSNVFRVLLVSQDGFHEDRLADVARISTGYDFANPTKKDVQKDEILLKSLFKMKHFSVFEFSGATFQIECPIYVARQLMRYRSASYIERSLRRCKPFEEDDAYESAISDGSKKEDARSMLPLSTKTRFLWKMNLREMLHVFDERLTPTAQPITRSVVEAIFEESKKLFPVILRCWEDTNEKQSY